MIKINKVVGDELYRRYKGQISPQPCYVELNLKTKELSADYRPDASLTTWNDNAIRWTIPPLNEEVANELLEKIKPLAERLIEGVELEDLEEVTLEVEKICDKYKDCEISVWEASEYYGPLGSWEAQGRCLGISKDTNDDILDEIIINEEKQAKSDEVTVHGIDAYLILLRDKLREE